MAPDESKNQEIVETIMSQLAFHVPRKVPLCVMLNNLGAWAGTSANRKVPNLEMAMAVKGFESTLHTQHQVFGPQNVQQKKAQNVIMRTPPSLRETERTSQMGLSNNTDSTVYAREEGRCLFLQVSLQTDSRF